MHLWRTKKLGMATSKEHDALTYTTRLEWQQLVSMSTLKCFEEEQVTIAGPGSNHLGFHTTKDHTI